MTQLKPLNVVAGLYLLECGDARSSWKRWQDNCFAIARKSNNFLFTKDTIADLCDKLDAQAALFKNGQKVIRPDWLFSERHGYIRPSIGIGEGCTIHFTPVKGIYYADAE